MVAYEEAAENRAPSRLAQIRGLLLEKPMCAKEIAEVLEISVSTVKTHLRKLTKRDEDIGKARMGHSVYYYLRSVLTEHRKGA